MQTRMENEKNKFIKQISEWKQKRRFLIEYFMYRENVYCTLLLCQQFIKNRMPNKKYLFSKNTQHSAS